ncbi:MAG: ChaN family lipoprotein [Rhodomicrobiaceae bacterium]
MNVPPIKAPVRSLAIGAAALFAATLSIVPAAGETQEGTAQEKAEYCDVAGNWLALPEREPVAHTEILEDLARKRVVLLGETHDDAEHHRWQLHTLAALHGRGKPLVIGLEMFPRAAQPVLDKWVRGELSREDFLASAGWTRIWGYPSGLYMPIFDFARMHRIPMKALNVERGLVARVGREGWDAVPEPERQGVSTPAPASQGYQRMLAEVYALKEAMPSGDPGKDAKTPDHQIEIDDAKLAEFQQKDDFRNFVAAQQVWDRAMAQALAEASKEQGDALVVAIVGSGHVEGGFGIRHQLEDLGMTEAATAIPVGKGEPCETVDDNYSDAIFVVDDRSADTPPAPKLGVRLAVASAGAGVKVEAVGPGSIAETAGLKKGDRIVQAAGTALDAAPDLIEVVTRQAPGTWLPLQVRRDEETLDLVAKFPAKPGEAPAQAEDGGQE